MPVNSSSSDVNAATTKLSDHGAISTYVAATARTRASKYGSDCSSICWRCLAARVMKKAIKPSGSRTADRTTRSSSASVEMSAATALSACTRSEASIPRSRHCSRAALTFFVKTSMMRLLSILRSLTNFGDEVPTSFTACRALATRVATPLTDGEAAKQKTSKTRSAREGPIVASLSERVTMDVVYIEVPCVRQHLTGRIRAWGRKLCFRPHASVRIEACQRAVGAIEGTPESTVRA